MPTYEYRCNACKREFEIQQRMADPDLVKCEDCGADALEKLISWTSVAGSRQSQEAALFSSNPRAAMQAAVSKIAPPKKAPPAPVPSTMTPPPAPLAAAPAPLDANADDGDHVDHDDDDDPAPAS